MAADSPDETFDYTKAYLFFFAILLGEDWLVLSVVLFYGDTASKSLFSSILSLLDYVFYKLGARYF